MQPQRPRSHQLETESQAAFKGLFEPLWVFRSYSPDYGIDGEVEIFDSSGAATGQKFLVQLKGTDTDSQTVSLKRTTAAYCASQKLPVLIVLFQAQTRKVLGRWFHSFDPYDHKSESETISLRFAATDELTAGNRSQLERDVTSFSAATSPHLPLPLTLTVDASGLKLNSASVASVRAEIDESVARVSKVLRQDGANSMVEVQIMKAKLSVRISKIPACIMHYPDDQSEETFVRDLPNSVLFGVGLALYHLRHFVPAADCFDEKSVMSIAMRNPHAAFKVAHSFILSGRTRQAIEIAKKVSSSASPDQWIPLMCAPLGQLGEMSPADRQCYEDFLLGLLADTPNVAPASAHYSLGNFFRATQRLRKAYHHFRLAAKIDPDYLKRSYFLSELAGVCFDKGRYKLAENLYQAANATGAEDDQTPFIADASFFRGNYLAAAILWKEHIEKTPGANLEWRLKHLMARKLVELGFEAQSRDSLAALEIQKEVGPSDAERLDATLKALKVDMLCSLAWFNRGVGSPGYSDQFLFFLFAALTNTADLEAWRNAALLSFKHGDGMLTTWILADAFFYHKQAFVKACIATFEKNGKSADQFLELMREVQKLNIRKERIPKLRILKDGKVIEIKLDWLGGGISISKDA